MNCDKCGRSITKITRWHDSYKPAELNDEILPGDQIGWLEVAPGEFIPANHHQCPGKLDEAEWRKKRDKQRYRWGLDMKRQKRSKA